MNQNESETTSTSSTQSKEGEKPTKPKQKVEIYILIENPVKTNSLGPIIRTCVAFAITEIILIGYNKFNKNGSFGSSKYIKFITFTTFEQAICYLNNEKQCDSIFGLLSNKDLIMDDDNNNDIGSYNICDVVTSNNAIALTDNDIINATSSSSLSSSTTNATKSYPIDKIQYHNSKNNDNNVCFHIHKKKDIIHKKYCTNFIHIPCVHDYLDITTKLAIVLHSFITNTLLIENNNDNYGYCKELEYNGYKYDLDTNKKINGQYNYYTNSIKEEKEANNKKENDIFADNNNDYDEINLLNNLFTDDE